MKTIITIAFTIFIAATCAAQLNHLIIPTNISLPEDTILKNQLLADLNGFLSQKERPNKENTFVRKDDLLEASIWLDEIKGMEKDFEQKVDTFYKAYLTNLLRLNDSTFKIQLAYLGVSKDVPIWRANFTFLAQRNGSHFAFQSPLRQNTITWKEQNIGNVEVYYKNNLNTERANEYFRLADEFDRKLNVPIKPTIFYCCDNFSEALQLIGVDGKSDYNGITFNTLTAYENETNLVVNGTLTSDFTVFDPHDLWHNRLSLVVSRRKVNKPVDEGCAYLYGGSWGLSWKEIFSAFKEQIAVNRNINWLDVKEVPIYFKTNQFDNSADYIINALIVQKIEKEKGFAGVWELLNVGPFEKGNEKYYQTLEKLTGITKASYNQKIWELVDNEK